MAKVQAAILGSGNIGTDLMMKILRLSDTLEMGALVGIDPKSDGLARASRIGVTTTGEGVDGLIGLPGFDDIEIIFDATSAEAHHSNYALLEPYKKTIIDLTPAAIGPYVVPPVNLTEHSDKLNINMVTCGGQATIPIIHAVSSIVPVHYGEIVASISSRSAGPGTRANIDEFTETTSTAIEVIGGAARGKAIIVLNPADPPIVMRDTVLMISDRLSQAQRESVAASVEASVREVSGYVPGYRLKQSVQFDDAGPELDQLVPEELRTDEYTRVAVYLEVEGAAMYLPSYAGNLDIMTSAALRTAEYIVSARKETAA